MGQHEADMARRWASTDSLYLHVAMCLLDGEWRKCAWCRPLIGPLYSAVRRHQKRVHAQGKETRK